MDPVKAFRLGLDFKKVEKEHLDFSSLLWILWNQQILGWISQVFHMNMSCSHFPDWPDFRCDAWHFLFCAEGFFPCSGTYLQVRRKEECRVPSTGNKILLLLTCCKSGWQPSSLRYQSRDQLHSKTCILFNIYLNSETLWLLNYH